MKVYKFVFGVMRSTYFASGKNMEEALKKARKVADKELVHSEIFSAEYLGELCP